MRLRPRIFISSGQRKDSEELSIVKRTRDRLRRMGFDPYVAVEEQTLRGLVENIFYHLERSEYILFIDFRRERVLGRGRMKGGTGPYRGSVFSHQELAIATFLEIPLLGFQEQGNRAEDGIVRSLQANLYPFKHSERHRLPNLVEARVRERLEAETWSLGWRRELRIQHEPSLTSEAYDAQLQRPTRWLHFLLHNLDHRKPAYDCVAYTTEVRNVASDVRRTLPLVEMKFHGIIQPSVIVPPKESRQFAALRIVKETPPWAIIAFNPLIVDFTGFMNDFRISEPGDHDIRVVAYSRNFNRVEARFRFHLADRAEECTLRPLPASSIPAR
ncbi:MAG: hypothetical protein WBW47_07555 [Thermoplasmata archaeon]